MIPIKQADLKKAGKNASSYQEFKDNLSDMGYRVPRDTAKFPMFMKGFRRKLQYEISRDSYYGKPTTGHDIRQAAYYKRLERLGCLEPLVHMH